MNNNLQKKIFSLLLLQLLMLSVSFSQNYNDGRIRLRVWINKVWSNSNCGEIGIKNTDLRAYEQEYLMALEDFPILLHTILLILAIIIDIMMQASFHLHQQLLMTVLQRDTG